MEESILKSTKKILGLEADYLAFDPDVITHINAAFSILDQLGVGPEGGFFIVDESAVWADFIVPPNQLNLVKTYIYLKVRVLFDPPGHHSCFNRHKIRLESTNGDSTFSEKLSLPLRRC